jgi:membrane protein
MVGRARRRSRLVDHTCRAAERYFDVLGGRLSAAIAYYAFFAAYSLGVLAYSIVGRLLGPGAEGGALSAVSDYLQTTLPWVAGTARDVGRGQVTVVAAVALIVSGVGWVEALRSSLRAIWCVDQHPGNFLLRRFVDLGMLVGLGLLLGLSLATTDLLERLLDRYAPQTGVVGRSIGPVLEFVVNVVLASATLTAVPRMRLSLSRWLPPALGIAIGIQVLNTVGRLAIERTQGRPAFAAVAGDVGLLVYLYVLNQVILIGAAFAATAERGTAFDLGRGAAGLGRRGEALGGPT